MTDEHTPVGNIYTYYPASDLQMYNNITKHPEDTHVLFNPSEPIYAQPANIDFSQVELNMQKWHEFKLPPDHPLHKNFYHVSCCHKRTSGGDKNGPQFGIKFPWTDYFGYQILHETLSNLTLERYAWDWNSQPKYLLSYTAARPKRHRMELLVNLIDLGLMPKSIVNFCNNSDLWNQFLRVYKGSHFIEKILPYAADILHAPIHLEPNQSYHRPNELIPGYELTLCELVSETDNSYVMLSEKTFRPLIFGKPFVVLGGAGQREGMQSLGFEEYNELFNYNIEMEFDNDYQKYEEIIKPLCDIDTSPKALMDLKIKLQPKVKHNQSVMIKRLFDDTLLPKKWMCPPWLNTDKDRAGPLWIMDVRNRIKNNDYFGKFV